jgi:serpin B
MPTYTKASNVSNLSRAARFEPLERRVVLSRQPCLFDVPQGEAARAVEAVNCFGADLYSQLQQQEGNLFFSPLSLTTALAMTYAGAAGQTAAEMEDVLHLGTEPGIHQSFAALLGLLADRTAAGDGFTLELANAIWAQSGLPLHDEFIDIIEGDYDGAAQRLDFSDLDMARQIINTWVEDKTHGRVKDLLEYLDPATILVLTNSIYFNADWTQPFNPKSTNPEGRFLLESGETVEVPMMYASTAAPLTYIDGYQVLEMPLEWGRTSMVVVLPGSPDVTPNHLTPELLVKIDDWLEGPRRAEQISLYLPKFTTTVSTQLEDLLSDMGMPSAFDDGAADFSKLTPLPIYIEQVRHKAFFEMNEEGTEAAAATAVVGGFICFAAGTPVLTPDGEIPIEQIKAGDYVVSKDESDVGGKVERKPVEATFRRYAELIQLHVGGQTIRATSEHPFFVQGKGWTPLGELRRGDLLATDEGSWMSVERVTSSGQIEPVYNFRVADFHTYFVGGRTWKFSLWTHNNCVPTFQASHPFHFFIRDNVSSAVLFMGRVDDPTQSENDLHPNFFPDLDRSVSGTVYFDADRDGARDAGEPPLEGWSVFMDADHNGVWSATEPRVTTRPDGSYSLWPTLSSGSMPAVVKVGFHESVAASRELDIAAGQHALGLDIGIRPEARRDLSSVIEIEATSGNDSILVRRNGDNVEVFLDEQPGSAPAARRRVSAISEICLQLLAGNDEVVIDYAGGNPLPAGGLSMDVGGGQNALRTMGQARGEVHVSGGELEIAADPGGISLIVEGGATVRLNSSAHLLEAHVTEDSMLVASPIGSVLRARSLNIGARASLLLNGGSIIVNSGDPYWAEAQVRRYIHNGQLRDIGGADLRAQVNYLTAGTPYVTSFAGEEVDIYSVLVGRSRRTGVVGDYDNSGVVDQGDLDLVLAYWGADAATLPARWMIDRPLGQVSQQALDAVLLNWGKISESLFG